MAIDIDDFVQAYLECALWTDSISEDDDRSIQTEHTPLDLVPAARELAEEDCRRFVTENAELLERAVPLYAQTVRAAQWSAASLAGHDFWLTRNGHGTGFWDRGLGQVGEYLSSAASAYGKRHAFVTDDGRVEII